MTVYSEEQISIPFGRGLDTYNHPSNLAEGYVPEVVNFIARGDRLISRKGFVEPTGYDTRGPHSAAIFSDVAVTTLPPSDSGNTLPIALWNSSTGLWGMRQFSRTSMVASPSQAIVKFTAIPSGEFNGAVRYLDKTYALTATAVYTLDTWNWAAGTYGSAAIGSSPVGGGGIFAFKDRLWVWQNNKLYYTDAVASPGAYPETWNTTDNFIVVGSAQGAGSIMKVIPVGTKLYVFTTYGLYNISVIGSPANWVVRLMDSRVRCSNRACAVEYAGIVYFIDYRGVWATNGSDIRKISNLIEPFFRETTANTTETFVHRIYLFDEGILISRATYFEEAGSFEIASEGKLFYTELNNIFWTEWQINTTNNFFADLQGAIANTQRYDENDPLSYILCAFGDSAVGASDTVDMQLLQYSGYTDNLRMEGGSVESSDVVCTVTTKTVRAPSNKAVRAKYGYVNFTAPIAIDADPIEIVVTWDTETAETIDTTGALGNFDAAWNSKIKVPADFWFNFVKGNVSVTLSSYMTEIQLLSLDLVVHTHRNEPRTVS